MSLLVAAYAEFELSDPWDSPSVDSSIYKKRSRFLRSEQVNSLRAEKAKIRKLVQVSRKNGIHWRSQLVDAIKNQSVKLDASASKLGRDVKRIAVNNPAHQIGIAARPITRFEEIGRDMPKKVLQAAAQTPKNNNRLVLALSGLSAIGTAGLYLSNRSSSKQK